MPLLYLLKHLRPLQVFNQLTPNNYNMYKFYFEPETIEYFAKDKELLTIKELKAEILEFVQINCIPEPDETDDEIASDLLRQVLNY